MSNTIIQLKSSSSLGNVPNVLYPGELAINYGDGKLYYGNTSNQAILFDVITEPAGLNQEIQFNDSGSFGSSANLKFNSSTKTLTTHDLIVANTLMSITTNNIINVSSSIFSQANLAFTKANSANILAQSAYDFANNFTSSDYFPTSNVFGFVSESIIALVSDSDYVEGEFTGPLYDCSSEPITPRGFYLIKDFGNLT